MILPEDHRASEVEVANTLPPEDMTGAAPSPAGAAAATMASTFHASSCSIDHAWREQAGINGSARGGHAARSITRTRH
jgi:hypothetical protein